MLKTLGIVQVALGGGAEVCAERWAGLVRRKLGGQSLLDWVVRRVTEAEHLDGVVALLPQCEHAVSLAQVVPADVPVFTSSESQPLARLIDVLGDYPAQSVVLVSIDNPFVDPGAIDRLVITAADHPQCDYIGYCTSQGQPTVQSRLGLFAEWCRAAALREAHRRAQLPEDLAEPTRYLISHPELFQLRLIPLPSQLDRDDLRLRLDGEEDWENAQAIVEALGLDSLDWQRIAGLLDHQPVLRQRMALLNQSGPS